MRHVLGLLDVAARAELGDVHQAVDATQVDEGSEGYHGRDAALTPLTDGQAVQRLPALALALFARNKGAPLRPGPGGGPPAGCALIRFCQDGLWFSYCWQFTLCHCRHSSCSGLTAAQLPL